MIVSVCNEKGGSGKTNIAHNLAVKLGLDGDDTLLVDSDPQRSTEVFLNIRADRELPITFNAVTKFGNSLSRELKSLETKYNIIVVDTGGRDSNEMRQAMLVSNIVIIPTLPSDVDIAVLNRMINLFTQTKIYNPNLKALVVISKASPNPSLSKKIESLREYIAEKNVEYLNLMDSILYEREAYRNAFTNGKGIVEFCGKKDKAYEEFTKFFKEFVKNAKQI